MENVQKSGCWMLFWVVLGAALWGLLFWLLLGMWGCMYVSGNEAEAPAAKVTFLDVGQGLSVLLEYDGKFALYDAGPDSVGVLDSLKALGVDTLEWGVMSHGHRDHGGGLMELLGTTRDKNRLANSSGQVVLKRLYMGPDTADSFVGDSVLRIMKRLNIPVDTLYRGDEISLGDLRLKVLWPVQYISVGDNQASLVLEASLNSHKVLLTGDLDSIGERRLLELSPNLEASLLQVAHHGSAGSSTLRFLSQVAPDYAVISVGAHNGYGHPAPSVLRKLSLVTGDSARILQTLRDGSVTFHMEPGVGVVRSVP